MEDLKRILKERLGGRISRQIEASQVCELAKKIGFSPISFSDGRLKLAADSPEQATDLKFRSEEIIDRLNHRLGAEVVKRVVAVVGTIPDNNS